MSRPAPADPGPQLKNAENLCLALLYDLTAAMAKQAGVPDRRYALPALIRDRVLDPWARIAAYCAPRGAGPASERVRGFRPHSLARPH